MATKAGTGFSELAYSREAGREAVSAALKQAGTDSCDLVIMYATSKHDPVLFRDGVRDIIGEEPHVVGGAAVGVITNDDMGYEGSQAAVAVLQSDSIDINLFKERGLAGREFEVGRRLGRQIRSKNYDEEPNLFLMFDLVKNGVQGGGFELNVTTPLLRGLQESLGSWPSTAGLGMVGSFQFTPGFHWFEDDVEGERPEEQSALALVLSGNVVMDTIIMHGCRPSSGYHTVTKTAGNIILELDGKPALDVVQALFGTVTDVSWEDFPTFTNLGVNKGEKFQEFSEDSYSVRMCQDVDRDRGGLIVAADDMIPGTEVQFMRRSVDFSYIGSRIAELQGRMNGRHPFLAIYVDCAARAGAFLGSDEEEAHEVQNAFRDVAPLLGMYSGVEIARVGNDIVQNNMTGVVCLFSEANQV